MKFRVCGNNIHRFLCLFSSARIASSGFKSYFLRNVSSTFAIISSKGFPQPSRRPSLKLSMKKLLSVFQYIRFIFLSMMKNIRLKQNQNHFVCLMYFGNKMNANLKCSMFIHSEYFILLFL